MSVTLSFREELEEIEVSAGAQCDQAGTQSTGSPWNQTMPRTAHQVAADEVMLDWNSL